MRASHLVKLNMFLNYSWGDMYLTKFPHEHQETLYIFHVLWGKRETSDFDHGAYIYIYIYMRSFLLSPVTLKRLDTSVARQSCTESNWQRPGSECFQSSNHRVFVCCPACCVMYSSTLLSRSCSPHMFLLEDVPTARQVWRRGQVFLLARRPPPREAVRISRLEGPRSLLPP